jgi:LmbE family N-acetylglucosaminyl deacetylase
MTDYTLAVVLAHPDDESFPIGGTLARYAAEGVKVDLIVATRGEAGIPSRTTQETAQQREAELRRACAELGVHRLEFLGFSDGHLAEVDDEVAVSRLLKALHRSSPEVIITFGPDGISGHPDHVAVSRCATLAFDRLRRAAQVPRRLYYIAPSAATQQGCGVPPPAEAVGGPVTYIDIDRFRVQKVRAAQQHQSQNPPFAGQPEHEADKLVCHKAFRLARPVRPVNGNGPLPDLFARLN